MIGHIPENTLIVDVEAIPAPYIPPLGNVVVRHEFGKVVLFVGKRRAELTTITAHGIGMAIMKGHVAPNEMIVLKINSERFELLLSVAKKLAAALLRKADDADDWQIQNRRKLA